MIPQIEFIRPANLQDALIALSKHSADAIAIAGGTDIIPGFQQGDARLQNIRSLVDIHHLPELKRVEERNGGVSLGAGITFTDLAAYLLAKHEYPLLMQAALTIGNAQIRNRATLAGNFVNNAACADSVPPLLVYDATVRIRSTRSQHEMPLHDFLPKPNHVQLRADELVVEILLPKIPTGCIGKFYKLGRRRGTAVSRISLAVLIRINENTIEDIRIASGAVTPIGVRFRDLEKATVGQKVEKRFLKSLALEVGDRVLNTTGIRWSTPYKLPVVEQMFYQLLCELCGFSAGLNK